MRLLSLLLTFMALAPNFTAAAHTRPPANPPRAARQGKTSLQGQPGRPSTFGRRDHASAVAFETVAFLRLYGIYIEVYNGILRDKVNDLESAAAVQEKLAELSQRLHDLSRDTTLADVFVDGERYYTGRAQLYRRWAAEARASRLSPAAYRLVMTSFVKGLRSNERISVQEAPILQRWSASLDRLQSTYYSSGVPKLEKLARQYQFNHLAVLDDFNALPPLRLPLAEQLTPADYLYESYLEDADLERAVKGYFSDDWMGQASVVAKEMGIHLPEVLAAAADVATLGRATTARAFLKLFFSAAMDAYLSEFSTDSRKLAYLEDLYKTITTISSHLSVEQQKAEDLLEFCRSAQAALSPHLRPGDARLEATRHLTAQVSAYLDHRVRLYKYADGQANFVWKGKDAVQGRILFGGDFGQEQFDRMQKRMVDIVQTLRSLKD